MPGQRPLDNLKEIVDSYFALKQKPDDLVTYIDGLKWEQAKLHCSAIKRELQYLTRTRENGIHLFDAFQNYVMLSYQIRKEIPDLNRLSLRHNGYKFTNQGAPPELHNRIDDLENFKCRLYAHIIGLEGRDRLEQSIKCDQVFQHTLACRENKDAALLESKEGSLDKESARSLSAEFVQSARERILATQANMALDVLQQHDSWVNQYRSLESAHRKQEGAIKQLESEKVQLQELLEAGHAEQGRLNQNLACSQQQLVEARSTREDLQTQLITEKAQNEQLQLEITALKQCNQELLQALGNAAQAKKEANKIPGAHLIKLIKKHKPVFFAQEKEFEGLSSLATSRAFITLGEVQKVIKHNPRLLQISENPKAHQNYKAPLANFIRDLATKLLIEDNAQRIKPNQAIPTRTTFESSPHLLQNRPEESSPKVL